MITQKTYFKKYTAEKYRRNELLFAEKFPNLTPRIISIENDGIHWEYIDGRVPDISEVVWALREFMSCQTSENGFDVVDYKSWSYPLEEISPGSSQVLDMIVSNRVICHGDAHKNNFLVSDRFVFLDTSFCCVASPYYDIAKATYLVPSIMDINNLDLVAELYARTLIDMYGIFCVKKANISEEPFVLLAKKYGNILGFRK